MKTYTILPEGLSEETLGAYLEGSLDIEQEIEIEEILTQWDEVQGFVNDLADDVVRGEMEVDSTDLPPEDGFVLPYISGLDDMVVVDDDDADTSDTIVDINDWNPGPDIADNPADNTGHHEFSDNITSEDMLSDTDSDSTSDVNDLNIDNADAYDDLAAY